MIATAESASQSAVDSSVMLKHRKPSSRPSQEKAYANFLGKLSGTLKSSQLDEEIEEDEESAGAAAARAERKSEAERQRAIDARRDWVEKMEAETEAAERVESAAATSASRHVTGAPPAGCLF